MTYSRLGARLLTPFVLAVSTGCSVAAIEAPELQVFVTGPGKGKVTTFMSEGIDCGDDCAQAYEKGLEVVLTATAAPGSVFSAWFGACTGRAGCRVKMDQDRTVTASFEITAVELKVTKSGLGGGTVTSTPAGIDCGIACSNPYPLNQAVTLTAAPDSGSRFLGWTGACSGTGACEVVMGGNRAVDAMFDIATSSVTIVKTGQGMGRITSNPAGIDCGSTCGAELRNATMISLFAAPVGDSVFSGWSGPCTGIGPCTFTLDRATTVRAEFVPQLYRLTVMRSGSGSGTVVSTPSGIDCGTDCEGEFRRDTMVTLRATAAAESSFTGWSGACSGTANCVVRVDAAKMVTATFRSDATTVTVRKVGRGSGRVTSAPSGIDCGSECTATFMRNSNVTLTAAADMGARFAGWSGACTGMATCMLRLSESRTATATFELERRSLEVVRLGTGSGRVTSAPSGIDCGTDCSGDFEMGTMVTLTAVAAPGASFTGWTGPCSGTGTCTVTVQAASSVGATFASRYTVLSATIFAMGSPDQEGGRNADEGPVRTMTITSAFLLKTTEVTQREWRNVMRTSPSAHAMCGDECPVENITFDEAIAYVNALSDREGLERCYLGAPGAWTLVGIGCTGYRLPTEAEWEAAARAGSSSPLPTGPLTQVGNTCGADANLDQVAWHCGNAMSTPHPVAQKTASPFGLYDMAGNVAEWVNDLYDPQFYTTSTIAADNTGPRTGTNRVVRGGAYDSFPRANRSAARASLAPNMRSGSVGLRPARSLYVRIPAMAFDMGSPPTDLGRENDESPVHRVIVSRPFYLRAVEMTQGEWFSLHPANPRPSHFSMCGGSMQSAERCPVERVTRDDVFFVNNSLSIRHGLEQCYAGEPGVRALTRLSCPGYRLPTEAEWELAARGGSSLAFSTAPISSTGCDDPALNNLAWYCGSSNLETHPVAERLPNAFGLYDMFGNVAEWTQDAYDSGYYAVSPPVDPAGPADTGLYVVRGGSWSSEARGSRAANRDSAVGPTLSNTLGFRPARNACTRTGTSAITRAGEPGGRSGGVAIPANAELIVFGGQSQSATAALGGRYDIPTRRWSALPTNGAPAGRFGFAPAWTGAELLIFGGATAAPATSAVRGDGARFDPVRSLWTAIPSTGGAPAARRDAASAWTGTEWVIWGGRNTSSNLSDGARYLAATGAWLPMRASTLADRYGAAAAWTGTRVLVAAGRSSATQARADAALYDPFTDTWSAAMPTGGCSGNARAHVVGTWVVIASETGWCRYDTQTGTWNAVRQRPQGRALTGPDTANAGSSGAELFAFGGSSDPVDAALDAYDPGTDTWREVIARPGELPRSAAATAWTGCGLFTFSGTNNAGSGLLLEP